MASIMLFLIIKEKDRVGSWWLGSVFESLIIVPTAL